MLSKSSLSSNSMDRKIEKDFSKRKIYLVYSLGAFLLFLLFHYLYSNASQRSLTLDRSRITVSEVKHRVFEDYIPVRSYVNPVTTVYLDVVQGGCVENIYVEDGHYVEKGQTLAILSNSDLQLSVMSTESRLLEQLNYMRDQKLQYEKNRLNYNRELLELDFEIKQQSIELNRKKELFRKSLISASEYETFISRFEYLKRKRFVVNESKHSEEKLMKDQLASFIEKSGRIEDNLEIARKTLESLNITAPTSGKLSGFTIEIGQRIPRGLRLGQISKMERLKLTGSIDEYYLARIQKDLKATYTDGINTYLLKVVKIDPEVKNGQFEIDMHFVNQTPPHLKHGQSLQTKLTIGASKETLVVDNGQFYQDTGGKWVFVLSAHGDKAEKRMITTGKRNNRFIEIKDGLLEGERVISSSYAQIKSMDQLTIEKKD